LDEDVTEEILNAAFAPFGEIKEVALPSDISGQGKRHRGFGFVTFELLEDSKAAIENMNMAELFGRTIKCNVARPTRIKESTAADPSILRYLQKYGLMRTLLRMWPSKQREPTKSPGWPPSQGFSLIFRLE
jgi:RNA recognition motif-containing protein